MRPERPVKQALERVDRLLDAGEPEPTFPALHWMTAVLFLAAGTEALLRQRAPDADTIASPLDRPHRAGKAARSALNVAPLLAAPLAGAAHAARAVTNGPRLRLATQVLDGIAVGVAAAGLATAAYDALDETPTSADPAGRSRVRRSAASFAHAIVPVTFGAVAVLGMLLETEEEKERQKVERLRHRASIVQRLVPRRRARFDHIVLHI
jgi:hypothetical protein